METGVDVGNSNSADKDEQGGNHTWYRDTNTAKIWRGREDGD